MLILFLSSIPAAYAGDYTPYIGVGAGMYSTTYSENGARGGLSQSGSSGGGFIQAGIDYKHFGGIEGRIGGAGSSSGSFAAGTIGSATPFNLSTQMSMFISYLAKLQYPISPAFNVYAMFGGTAGRFVVDSNIGVQGSVKTWKTNFSYGAGLAFNFRNQFSVGLEWMQYWKDVPLSIVNSSKSQASMYGINAIVNKSF